MGKPMDPPPKFLFIPTLFHIGKPTKFMYCTLSDFFMQFAGVSIGSFPIPNLVTLHENTGRVEWQSNTQAVQSVNNF